MSRKLWQDDKMKCESCYLQNLRPSGMFKPKSQIRSNVNLPWSSVEFLDIADKAWYYNGRQYHHNGQSSQWFKSAIGMDWSIPSVICEKHWEKQVLVMSYLRLANFLLKPYKFLLQHSSKAEKFSNLHSNSWRYNLLTLILVKFQLLVWFQRWTMSWYFVQMSMFKFAIQKQSLGNWNFLWLESFIDLVLNID